MRGGRAGPADTFLSSRLPSARYLIRAGGPPTIPPCPPPPAADSKFCTLPRRINMCFFVEAVYSVVACRKEDVSHTGRG